MRNKRLPIIVTVLLLCSARSVLALPAPWYGMQEQLKAVLEGDPQVKVGPLQEIDDSGKRLKVVVQVEDLAKAINLQGLLPVRYWGDLTVETQVVDTEDRQVGLQIAPTNARQLADVIGTALSGNRHFARALANDANGSLFVEFSPTVVQYPADNYGDPYSHITLLAADAFRNSLELEAGQPIQVWVTTSPVAQIKVIDL